MFLIPRIASLAVSELAIVRKISCNSIVRALHASLAQTPSADLGRLHLRANGAELEDAENIGDFKA